MFSSYDVTVDLKYNLQLVMIAILNKRKRQNHVAMQKFVKKKISFLSRMMNWLLYLLPNLKLINQVVCLLKDECDQPCNKLHKVFACFQIQFRKYIFVFLLLWFQ